MPKIEIDTPLLPIIVADCVIAELSHYYGQPLTDNDRLLSANLALTADRIYSVNDTFHRRIRGRGGRDYLYCFMRHWLAAEMISRGLRVPDSFANGLQLPLTEHPDKV